ncbi:bifunctional diguanylate cyclase/phosphodiesterase [Pseudomonas sp. Irchel 3A5]|uniref:putative bifunctional diguanylate cyclase/phosphodiesterase n=1 Tax=Pseudomonas sp. Irchel 3A5 TaxID=2008911 RepID=UPI000BA35699|nr:bifunctional diguanylate cyclase/phosphodiesterase [Pseudomonas sp. Irchel 3A5]
MIAPILALYFISTGILVMGAFNAALLARNSGYTRACVMFSATCLVFALFQVACAVQYSAQTVQAALSAHKWINFFSLLLVPLSSYLIAALENRPNAYRASWLVAGVAIFAIVYNLAAPLGYRFESLHSEGLSTVAWGEQLFILSGEPSAIYQIMRLLSFTLLVWITLFSLRIRKQAGLFSNIVIWTSIVLLLTSTVLTSLADAGVVKVPYLGAFGFLFLAVWFSVMVKAKVSRSRQEKARTDRALEQEINSHRIANLRFEHALHNDALTELPNRAGALVRLQSLIAVNKQHQTRLVVFLLELDQMGIINGTRGHKAGDQLLVKIAQRLQLTTRDSDLIARVGTDQLLVGASGVKNDNGVNRLQEKLSKALASSFDIAGSQLKITSSAGVAVFPDDACQPEDILGAAELALHEAKSFGPGNLRVYHPAMKENIQERVDFEAALGMALEKGQFFLCYQPQVLASDGRTVCLEALIRWQHPDYGLVMPDRFIQVAESMGIIADMGAWVIETACEQLARWHAMGFTDLKVAVNLSVQQLLVSELESTVTNALLRCNLQGHHLELEITESVLMQDPERSIERLGDLRRLGVRLSIDDFGTGYSSLGYLRVLPVHAFKLDRSFVRDIGKGGKDLEICATAIGLAINLGLEIVAEGVETEEQIEQLRALGCHLLQGYFFARPLSAEAASDFLVAEFKRLETASFVPTIAVI